MAGNKITKINLNGVEYNLTDQEAQNQIIQLNEAVNEIPTKVSQLTNDSNFQTAAQVNQAIQNIVGAAPEALDTLEEIAAKLEGNDDVIDTINGVLAGKVDKETGKGLSSNDYTNIEKTKLSGIAEGAEVNQNAYSTMQIKNSDGQLKKVSADSKQTMFTLEVGENLIGTANGVNSLKLDLNIPEASGTKGGLMSAEDKTKLDTLPNNTYSKDELDSANNLVWNALNSKLDSEVFNDVMNSYAKKDSVVTSVAGKTGVVTLTKSDVGLGNVNNTSDMNKPVSTAQQAAIDEVSDKTANVSADLDKHKQDPFKHLPDSNEESGKVLTSSESNISQWKYLSEIIPNLEETVAYGVEWDVTVADPHLTRIGNMSLHKTLPIQSQLKGCIAQGDKIIYWLNKNDWNLRADSKALTKLYLDGGAGLYSKDPLEKGKEYYVGGMKVTCDGVHEVGFETYPYEVSFDNQHDLKLFMGSHNLTTCSIYDVDQMSRLDGYDGTVRVYCPNFYIKSQIIGNKRRVWLSTVKIDNTWTYQHEILIDAYRSTVLNTVPKDMGYLSTLPVNSAISVVNTATYCRGGGNSPTYDQYLESDPCRTGLGKPRTTGLNRATMRTYAKNAGSYIMSYEQYKNIMYWLYVVEYANFNSQEAFNEALTEEGYRQGGMGPGVTSIKGNYWSYYNEHTPLTPCGYLNEFGNGSGIKPMTLVTPTKSGGEPTQSYTFQVPRWRGFDNPFGDIWTNLDGIIIGADADIHPNNMNYVYACKNPEKFGEVLTDDWEKIGEEIHQDGYTKQFDLGDAAHIIPNVMGANTTTYKCDNHQTGAKDDVPRTLFVGGCADDGAAAGLGSFVSAGDVLFSATLIGFRSVSSFLSFSDN